MRFQQESRFLYVRDNKLAAALITLGAITRPQDAVETIYESGKTPFCLFWFNATDEASDYIKAWDCPSDCFDGSAPDHPLRNKEHPFWYIRAALRNRERVLDAIKQKSKQVHHVNKDGKNYLVTKNP
jgi:hypothetical protein